MDLLDDILSSMDKNKRPAISKPDKLIQSEFYDALSGKFHLTYFFASLIFRAIRGAEKSRRKGASNHHKLQDQDAKQNLTVS